MRPHSIVMFERLFLAGLALSVLNFVLSYQAMDAALESTPGLARMGSGALIGSFLAGIAIYLLLWFLVARRASNIARWVLVVIFGLGLLFSLPGLLAGPLGATAILALAVLALQLAAIVFLFRGDAVAWLSGPDDAAPSE